MENKYETFVNNLYKLREISLEKEGEYGIGNLLFKAFRNKGYLDNLKKLSNEQTIKNLSEKLKK